MQNQYQLDSQLASSELAVQQNRVLRNTYMLLGVTMVPTVLGAIVGVQTKFGLIPGSPFMSFLLMLGICFGFFWGIERTKNSGWGVALLLGFTFFAGLLLSGILRTALGFSNGGMMIAMAAAGTGAIFLTLSAIAATTKRNFTQMGNFLFIGLVVILLATAANIFFQIPLLGLVISGACILLFSAYILYDISNIVHGGETNYITATLSVYLDIYNIFVHLLNILMVFTGQRD